MGPDVETTARIYSLSSCLIERKLSQSQVDSRGHVVNTKDFEPGILGPELFI